MDWKLLATAFVSMFLAEIGDKTQLAAFALSGGNSKLTVFIGASLALVAATALAVLAAGFVERHVPTTWMHRGAGALFVVMGVLLLWSTRPGGDVDGVPPDPASDTAPTN